MVKHIATTFMVLAISACQSGPKIDPPPEVVHVTVREYVPVPDELTRECVTPPMKSRTVENLVETSNARKICEDSLNARMRRIRGLGSP
jgi:hypothetical protein